MQTAQTEPILARMWTRSGIHRIYLPQVGVAGSRPSRLPCTGTVLSRSSSLQHQLLLSSERPLLLPSAAPCRRSSLPLDPIPGFCLANPATRCSHSSFVHPSMIRATLSLAGLLSPERQLDVLSASPGVLIALPPASVPAGLALLAIIKLSTLALVMPRGRCE